MEFTLGYIVWNVRPELVQLGPLTVRWYGLFFALLFSIGYVMVRWQFRLEGKSTALLDNLLIYVVAGTIIGARLAHCFFYEPEYYLKHPLQILAVWKGGLASHGGTAGVMLAVWIFCARNKVPYLWLLDRMAVPTALASFFIRMGNLFNSEILGVPTKVPWAFVFPRVDDIPRHPAQLYEALSYLGVFFVLFPLYLKLKRATPQGLLVGIFLVLVFMARFLIEFVKERHASYEQALPISLGQILSIPFIITGLWLIYRASKRPAVT